MSTWEFIAALINKLEAEQRDLKHLCINAHNLPRWAELDALINSLYREKLYQEKWPYPLRS